MTDMVPRSELAHGSRNLGLTLLRIKKVMLVTAGTICVIIGCIGIVVPLLPTTPFLLLAAVCYAGSSEKFYRWLIYNRLFGSYIRNYREGRGMPLKAKVITLVMLWGTIGTSAYLMGPVLIAYAVLLIVAVGVTAHILHLPTYRSPGMLKGSQN